jgi:hypothetical protein
MTLLASDSVDIGNKTLIVPACSDSLTDNFALDWIIQTLNLKSVSVLFSNHVEPLIQPSVFHSPRPVTTAVELYTLPDSDLALIQIRSTVKSKSKLALELLEFAASHNVKEIILVAACSGFLLSGESLEKTSRIRGSRGLAPLPKEIHCGGMTKRFLDKATITLAITAGHGLDEVASLSEKLARAVLNDTLGLSVQKMEVPVSIKQLL